MPKIEGSIGPGRHDGKFDSWRYASDNGKDLVGKTKYTWTFDNDNAPMIPLKITKATVICEPRELIVNDVNSNGQWQINAVINGHVCKFFVVASRFGVIDHGIDANMSRPIYVDNKPHDLFAKNRGLLGYYGSALTFKPTLVKIGKSESFIGQRYKITNMAKDFITEFIKLAEKQPDIFSRAFKKSIGCQ